MSTVLNIEQYIKVNARKWQDWFQNSADHSGENVLIKIIGWSIRMIKSKLKLRCIIKKYKLCEKLIKQL